MTLKSISILLSYPQLDALSLAADMNEIFHQDPRLSSGSIAGLKELLAYWQSEDIYALQERYVALFDRSRTLSLNLFEHVHGESRDRGGAMVSLLETYQEAGFEPEGPELPDFLPILLEFLSTREAADANETLADAAHILEAIRLRLKERGSFYEAAFASLLELANTAIDEKALAEQLAIEAPEADDLEALDAVWEEAEVVFAPDPNKGCPQVRDMLSQMDLPANLNQNIKGGYDA